MYLEHIEKLDRDSLLSEDLLNELFSLDDVYVMEQNRQALVMRAAELKCKTDFNRLYVTYKKELRKRNLQLSDKPSYMTEFDDQPSFRSGSWVAEEGGIWILTE